MVKHIAPVQYFGPPPNSPDRFHEVQVLQPDGTPVSREHPSAQNLPVELLPQADSTEGEGTEGSEGANTDGGDGGQEATVTELAPKRVPKN